MIVLISNVCYNIMIDYVLLLQSLLVLELDLEERLTILDADLRDDRVVPGHFNLDIYSWF